MENKEKAGVTRIAFVVVCLGLVVMGVVTIIGAVVALINHDTAAIEKMTTQAIILIGNAIALVLGYMFGEKSSRA